MSWRSVVIMKPASLRIKQGSLVVEQDDGTVRVPLEDIAAILIDHPQITLTARLLSACAASQIAVITVGDTRHPNGVLVSYLPHSRALKVIRTQMDLSLPSRKRLWSGIVRRKIHNQGAVLANCGQPGIGQRLDVLASRVRSGDPENIEARAAQMYFPALFGTGFARGQEGFHNAALNYGYSILRAAIARSLVAYGFLTAIGLHHCNEQNAFNLADDLIEPFRPILDHHVLCRLQGSTGDALEPTHKAGLVGVLHQDIALTGSPGVAGRTTVLAAIDAVVMGLSRCLQNGGSDLTLPVIERNGCA